MQCSEFTNAGMPCNYEAAWGEIAYEIEHGGDPVAVLRAHFPEPARELTERFDTILMDWLNDHPRLCQRASVEDLFSLRDALAQAPKGVADVADMGA